MVITTFQNPACLPPPANQQNIPLPRETTLCLDLSLKHKINVLNNKQNSSNLTKNQYWAYLSTINPPKGKTYAMQSDILSNPNLHNLPKSGGGGLIDNCEN